MGNYFSYMRISTKESSDKQSFNRQEKSLKAYAENNKIEYTLSFKDDCTGSTFNRPEWLKLERLLQEGDTVIFKEISRFTREAEAGYKKYMELMKKGINLVFIDNMTVGTDYIKNLTRVASEQDLVAKTALESTIKLLLIVELDRVQKEREIIVKRIIQGIQASEKKSGRKFNSLDKMTEELRSDIKAFINDRSIKQIDLMNKHNISRNTLKKYVEIVKNEDALS
ncbi:recombinase family protein [Clostridium beijerinckii]|uniref:recombinase family protein n=1 Tax=Clostridium beijerinckii TaxID=1520 RepID=UPI000479FB78|nr:recombinase family protein [Clostridium beijerinckii]